MRYLRTNTAVIITVGPFYDKTDGVTIETGLTISNERITLTADTDDGNAPTNILDNVTGATSGTDNDLNYITNNDAGMMQLELSAANTNRLGRMFLSITDAANHVPVFHELMVLSAAAYDWLCGSTIPNVNATQISGDDTAADNAEAFFDGTGYAGTNNTIPTVTTTATTTNLTNLPAITNDWLTAAGVKADAVTKIQNGLATPTNITAGTITTVTNLTNAPTNGDLTATMKTSVETAATAGTLDLAGAIESNLTLREALRLIASATAGKLSGAATATITIRSARADDADRIIATVDADGNRTAIVYDVS